MTQGKYISIYIKPADLPAFEWAKTVERLSLSEVIARALLEYKDKVREN